MNSYRVLSILNVVFGVLYAVVALIILVFLALMGGVISQANNHVRGPEVPAFIAGMGILFVLMIAAIPLLFAVLHFVTAAQQSRGEGKTLQTVLAVLSVFDFPLGTAYAAYAIYVCWFEKPKGGIPIRDDASEFVR